jgi:dTDP-4-amino-4,6-dideoxygalactose transaminase
MNSTLFKKSIGVFLLLLSMNLSAQNNYKAEDLSIRFLKETYDNAFMNVTEVKDTYIVVKDVFSIYVEIDKNNRYVVLSAAYPLDEKASDAQILRLMNKLNDEIIMTKFYYDPKSKSVCYAYYLWTDRGFNTATLVSATKLFSQTINLSLDKDTERIIK